MQGKSSTESRAKHCQRVACATDNSLSMERRAACASLGSMLGLSRQPRSISLTPETLRRGFAERHQVTPGDAVA